MKLLIGISILFCLTSNALSGTSHSALNRFKEHGVKNVPLTTVELAKEFVKEKINNSVTADLERIFFIETHKNKGETIPGFFISEDGQSEFTLEDGSYLQSTLELENDLFKVVKEDKPQLVYKGKFLNSSFEFIFDFGDDEYYFIALEEFKKGNGTQKDKTIIKDTGGAVDPMDSNQYTLNSKLIFAQAAMREFAEEALGLRFNGEDDLKEMLELIKGILFKNGEFKTINLKFLMNMNESLVRLPNMETNYLCVATGTFAIKTTYESSQKDSIIQYLESKLKVEKGKKSQPKILKLSEFNDLKQSRGKNLQDRTKIMNFVDRDNFPAFDITEIIEEVL